MPGSPKTALGAVLLMVGALLLFPTSCGGALAWYHYGTDAAVPLVEVTIDELLKTPQDRQVPHYRVVLTVNDEPRLDHVSSMRVLSASSFDEEAHTLATVEENADILLLSKDELKSGRQQLIVHRFDEILVGCESLFVKIGTDRDHAQPFVVNDQRPRWKHEAEVAGRTVIIAAPLGLLLCLLGVAAVRADLKRRRGLPT